MTDKKSFLMLIGWVDTFNELTTEQAGQLIKGIYQYETTGEYDVITDPLARFAFKTNIKRILDEADENYSALSDKRKAAATKRWGKQSDAKDANACKCMQKEDLQCKAMPKAKAKDKDKDKDKDKGIGSLTSSPVDTSEQTENQKVKVNEKQREQAQAAAQIFSSSVRPIKDLKEAERIRSLVEEFGMPAFREAVAITRQRGGRSLNYVETVIRNPRPQRPSGPGQDAIAESTRILESEISGIFD